jgi:hypothetical protein
VARLDDLLAKPRLAAARKQELDKAVLVVKRGKVSHFDFIEDVVAYHIMKVVPQRFAYYSRAVHEVTTVAPSLACAQGYNTMRPPDLQISSTRQWRVILEMGPLTNAKRGKKKQRTSPRGKSKAGSDAEAMPPPPPRNSKKRVRASKYSIEKTGDVPWPTARLTGRHRLGHHEKGSKNTYCDYPGCEVNAFSSNAPTQGAEGLTTPTGAASSKARKASRSSGTGASRDPSPAGSQDSVASSSKAGAVKIFCRDCFDPTNTRPMNFHADCWNMWHGLCDECPP